jgi:cytoskeletal protein CcmA (bactofilin family)
MSISTRALALSLSLSAMALMGTMALAGDGDMLTRQLGNDTFASGGSVALSEEIYGDAIAAGGEVTIDAAVRGDALLAGGEVELGGTVDEDVYAAGGEVEVSGHILGSARIAGGDIELGPESVVDGAVSIAGGDVVVDGRIGQYLQVAAGSARIEGTVEGDVEVSGGSLDIGPRAVINGALTFRGPQPPEVADGATVRGGVQHIEAHERRGVGAFVGVFALLWLAGWLIVGWIVLALWPGFAGAVVDTARNRTAASFITGFALLVGVPILLVALSVSLIGLPLALLLLCVYLLLLPLGYIAAAAAIGDWLLPRLRRGAEIATRHRVFMLLGVLVALFVITRIPYLGGLVLLVVLLVGMGSLALAAVARHRAARTAAA